MTGSNQLARKITGSKTSSLRDALFSPKGLAAVAKTGGNLAGRNILRGAGGISGALIGSGAGLIAGGLASALTGEDQVVKGLTSGAAVGGNRGMQTSDYFREKFNNLHESGQDWLASQDEEYASQKIAQEIFEANPYMTDKDRDYVEQVYHNGASKEEIEKSLPKLLKSDLSPDEAAFKAHINSQYDLDKEEDVEKAVKTYGKPFLKKDNMELGITEEMINAKVNEYVEELESEKRAIERTFSKDDDPIAKRAKMEDISIIKSKINDRNNLHKIAENKLREEKATKLGEQIVEMGKF